MNLIVAPDPTGPAGANGWRIALEANGHIFSGPHCTDRRQAVRQAKAIKAYFEAQETRAIEILIRHVDRRGRVKEEATP